MSLGIFLESPRWVNEGEAKRKMLKFCKMLIMHQYIHETEYFQMSPSESLSGKLVVHMTRGNQSITIRKKK